MRRRSKPPKSSGSGRRRSPGMCKKISHVPDTKDDSNNDDKERCLSRDMIELWGKDHHKPNKALVHLIRADEDNEELTLLMAHLADSWWHQVACTLKSHAHMCSMMLRTTTSSTLLVVP